MSNIRAIDLFCGTGGLSLGLQQAGIEVVAGIDLERRCKYPYEHNLNAQFIEASVVDVTADTLNELWGGGEEHFASSPDAPRVNPFPANDGEKILLRIRTGVCLMNLGALCVTHILTM